MIYLKVFLNLFNPSNFRETLMSLHFPAALNAANSKYFAKMNYFTHLPYSLEFISL